MWLPVCFIFLCVSQVMAGHFFDPMTVEATCKDCLANKACDSNGDASMIPSISMCVKVTCSSGGEATVCGHAIFNKTRKCVGGKYESAEPCTGVTCSAVSGNHATPDSTSIPYNYNVVYTCETGYSHTDGTLTRTCQANGSLSGTAPVCTIKTCAVPSVDQATASPESTINYNTDVTYTCNAGYTLSGDATRRCNADGSLTGTEPVCNIKTCAVPSVDQATASPESIINYNTDVTYTCNAGYTLSGDATRRCNADGSLTGTEPVCNIKTCAVPSVDQATASPESTINYNTDVTYTCNTGYTLSGDATRRCNADGSLTGTEPVCNKFPVMCPALANPANGIVSTSDDLNVGSTATFKCNMCYTLYGDNVRVCQDDGSWSGDETTCEVNNPTVAHAGLCFTLFQDDKSSWEGAKLRCSDLVGGYLAELSTNATIDAIKSWLQETELFVPNLSEHERPGAIGMLKAGMRVSGVARYYNCLPAAIQYLRDCYQATRTVKGRHMPGQLIMVTDIKTATNADYIDDINIDDICSGWLPTLPDE